MKIVIDVPEKEYKDTLNGVFDIDLFRKAVIHGTVITQSKIGQSDVLSSEEIDKMLEGI